MQHGILDLYVEETPLGPVGLEGAQIAPHEVLLEWPRGIRVMEVRVKCRNPMVIHYVYDMERAKSFYESVFEVEPLFESAGWTTLDFGSIELALHILAPSSAEPEAPLPHAGLNLEVDDIEEALRRVEACGGTLVELREPSGGVPVRVASFRDCEGNGFELRQQPT